MEPVILVIHDIRLGLRWGCSVVSPDHLTKLLVLVEDGIQSSELCLIKMMLASQSSQLLLELAIFGHQAINLAVQARGLCLEAGLLAAQLCLLLLGGGQLVLCVGVFLLQGLLALLGLLLAPAEQAALCGVAGGLTADGS
jgi:hypothetical protein